MNKILGYYTVGNREYFSKIQAYIESTKTNTAVKWHFNNDVFGNFDWTIEPQESLDQLYNLRARQIREKYDYVALSYSGGSDSHNILMSFLRQGLRIDEIIVNTMEKGTKNIVQVSSDNKSPESGLWSEHLFQTMPMIRDISVRHPHIKISVYDMTDHLIETFNNAVDGSWVENRREVLNPCGTTRYNILAENDIKRRLDTGKNYCVILGVDKPKTYIDELTNDFYIIFNDRATNHGPTQHTGEYNNCTIELFYWSPSSVKMLSKQCHVLKQWIELNPILMHKWYLKNFTPDNWFNFQEPLLKTLIYTTWDTTWYQADKPTSDWHCEYDNWFFKNHTDSKAYYNWQQGIEYIKKNAASYLRLNKEGVIDSLKPQAHYYKIGKINAKQNI